MGQVAAAKGDGPTAWVTGGGGFLGAAAADRFQAEGWSVLLMGNGLDRHEGRFACLHGALDPAFFQAAIEAHGPPDLVVHAAGGSTVGAAQADPHLDFARTVGTTSALVHALGRAGAKVRLIYPSSVAVYGECGCEPIRESTPSAPVSHYGWHKLHAESVLRQAAAQYGLDVAIIRFFSLFGPGLRKQLFWDLSRRVLAGVEEIELGGSGRETRDFLYVEDAVDLLVLLARRRSEGVEVVNGASGRSRSVAEAANILLQELGHRAPVRFSGIGRPGDPVHHRACTVRLKDLDFAPRWTLEAGLRAYAEWIRTRGPT